MSSIHKIHMEYQQVNRQVNKLFNCAEDLNRINRQLNELMSDLRGCWEGESADAFTNKCSQLSGKIRKSSGDVQQTARVIERTARAYRDAELQSIQLTKN